MNVRLDELPLGKFLLFDIELPSVPFTGANVYINSNYSVANDAYAMLFNIANTTQSRGVAMCMVVDDDLFVLFGSAYNAVPNTVQSSSRVGRVPPMKLSTRLFLHLPNGFPIGTKIKILTM